MILAAMVVLLLTISTTVSAENIAQLIHPAVTYVFFADFADNQFPQQPDM